MSATKEQVIAEFERAIVTSLEPEAFRVAVLAAWTFSWAMESAARGVASLEYNALAVFEWRARAMMRQWSEWDRDLLGAP